jgi:tetratricopeptide (TPR) repeat protein
MNIISINDSSTRVEIARKYKLKQDYAKAIFILEQLPQKDLEVLFLLLDCYDSLHDDLSKLLVLRQIELQKVSPSLYHDLIDRCKKQKKFALAFHYALKASRKYKDDPDFKQEVMEILLKKRVYALALSYLKKHCHYFEEEKYLFYLAFIAKEMGRKWRALYYFKKIIAIFPFNTLYRYLIASIYESLGFIKKSKKQYHFIKDFYAQVPKMMNSSSHAPKDPFYSIYAQLLDEIK